MRIAGWIPDELYSTSARSNYRTRWEILIRYLIPIAKPVRSTSSLYRARFLSASSLAVQLLPPPPPPSLPSRDCSLRVPDWTFATSAAHLRSSRFELFRFRFCLVPANLRSTSAFTSASLSSLQSRTLNPFSQVSRGKSRGKLAGEDSSVPIPHLITARSPSRSVRLSRSWALSRIASIFRRQLPSTSIYFELISLYSSRVSWRYKICAINSPATNQVIWSVRTRWPHSIAIGFTCERNEKVTMIKEKKGLKYWSIENQMQCRRKCFRDASSWEMQLGEQKYHFKCKRLKKKSKNSIHQFIFIQLNAKRSFFAQLRTNFTLIGFFYFESYLQVYLKLNAKKLSHRLNAVFINKLLHFRD